jgi:hypothetical protein
MIKTRLFILFCFSFFNFIFSNSNNDGDFYNKTYFNDIMPFSPGLPERYDVFFRNYDESEFIITPKILFSSSQKSNYLASFFLPNGENIITIKGGPDCYDSNSSDHIIRDLDASLIGIEDDNFFSTLAMDMRSEIQSIGFAFEIPFFLKKDTISKWKIKAFIPVTRVCHKINSYEAVRKGEIAGAIPKLSDEQFYPYQWNFSDENMSNFRFADSEILLSYKTFIMDRIPSENALGIIVPFGNKNEKKFFKKRPYVFSPIVGNGGHFGLEYDSNISFPIYESEDSSIDMMMFFNTSYLFSNEQDRIFSPKNKPWGFYIPAYINFLGSDQKLLPLTNFVVLPCEVSPHFSFVASTELSVVKNNLMLNIGYSFYTKQAESGVIQEIVPEVIICGSDKNKKTPINPVRTAALRFKLDDISIADVSDPLYNVSVFSSSDLDISSALHPAVLMGIFYGRIGLIIKDFYIDIGLSYRYSSNNSAIKYTTAWASISFSF